MPRDPASKIMDTRSALAWRKSVAGPVVFTNGVFDIIHTGHIGVLDSARREGAALVVGINSDASVRRLKGETRPVCNERQRSLVVAALECVDAVVVFSEDTPYEIVSVLVPDVIVKGGDYTPANIVGADVVRAHGGRVVVVPTVPGYSTTSIIERIRD